MYSSLGAAHRSESYLLPAGLSFFQVSWAFTLYDFYLGCIYVCI